MIPTSSNYSNPAKLLGILNCKKNGRFTFFYQLCPFEMSLLLYFSKNLMYSRTGTIYIYTQAKIKGFVLNMVYCVWEWYGVSWPFQTELEIIIKIKSDINQVNFNNKIFRSINKNMGYMYNQIDVPPYIDLCIESVSTLWYWYWCMVLLWFFLVWRLV